MEYWSNQASLGYAILAAKKMGFSDEKIQELVINLHGEFDMKTVEEAAEVYRKSAY